MWSAHATTSLVPRNNLTNPGITLKVKYGYVNITNTQSVNSFITYANGTIYFDLSGNERSQGIYNYIVKSYGNGTLNLQFSTFQVPSIVAAQAASVKPNTTPVVVNYSANVASDPLILTFIGTASSGLANGVVNGSSWFPVIFTFSAILMVFSTVDGVVAPLAGRKPRFIPPQYAAPFLVVSIMIFVSTLIIGAIFAGVLKGTIAG